MYSSIQSQYQENKLPFSELSEVQGANQIRTDLRAALWPIEPVAKLRGGIAQGQLLVRENRTLLEVTLLSETLSTNDLYEQYCY